MEVYKARSKRRNEWGIRRRKGRRLKGGQEEKVGEGGRGEEEWWWWWWWLQEVREEKWGGWWRRSGKETIIRTKRRKIWRKRWGKLYIHLTVGFLYNQSWAGTGTSCHGIPFRFYTELFITVLWVLAASSRWTGCVLCRIEDCSRSVRFLFILTTFFFYASGVKCGSLPDAGPRHLVT